MPSLTTVPAATGPKSHATGPDVLLMEVVEDWAEAIGALLYSRAIANAQRKRGSASTPAKRRKETSARAGFGREGRNVMDFSSEINFCAQETRDGMIESSSTTLWLRFRIAEDSCQPESQQNCGKIPIVAMKVVLHLLFEVAFYSTCQGTYLTPFQLFRSVPQPHARIHDNSL